MLSLKKCIFLCETKDTTPTNYKSCKGELDQKWKTNSFNFTDYYYNKICTAFEAARFLPRSLSLMMHAACFLPSPSVLKVPHIFITRSVGLNLP